MPEGKAVNQMFSGIASRYDLANHVLSGGLDFYWRSKLVRMVKARQPAVVVDLATGSGDVAFTLRKHLPAETRVTGLDFCQPMLDEAEMKRQARLPKPDIRFAFGDCLNLPLESGSVDVLTISFGLRNLEDRQAGLKEMRRVLKPETGRLFILEFSQPQRWFAPLYFFYLKNILPFVARVVTGDKDAYVYLGDTIEAFPSRAGLADEIRQAGFREVNAIGMTFGSVAIHEAIA